LDVEQKIEKFMRKVGFAKEKEIREQLIDRISKEKEINTEISVNKIVSQIKVGQFKQASLDVTLLARPHLFSNFLNTLRENLNNLFYTSDLPFQKNSFLFLTNLTINLKSFLPSWNLQNEYLYPKGILTKNQIDYQINENRSLLKKWERDNSILHKEVLSFLNETTKERLESEGVNSDDLQVAAERTVGDSINHYLDQMLNFIESSNLKKIAEMRNNGSTLTEIGNDYAAHLQEAMWLGASFVTTNPQLVYLNLERKLDISDSQIDELIRQFLNNNQLVREATIGEETIEQFTDIFISEVVLNNARLLRDVFLLTNGNMGYICLQVNPSNHGSIDKMLDQALRIYLYLFKRLGGIPNVVFKLPGTKAGLEVAKILTQIGIGVTITVDFGLFQLIPFAKAVNPDKAIVSHLVLMNGRLAFPVRDELLSLGAQDARKVAQYAGVAVAKKAYKLLYSKENLDYNPAKVKLLVASLRNYNNFFPDITELLGVPIITVFPNIRHQFDSEPHALNPMAVQNPIDEAILKSLCKSEIFKQAYYLPGDSEMFRPKSVLSLDKTNEVQIWPPIKATLDGFANAHESTKEKLHQKMGDIISS
jgi:transaldolase